METTLHTTTNLNLPSADKRGMEWIVRVAATQESSFKREESDVWNLGFPANTTDQRKGPLRTAHANPSCTN
jgi:hypothetical protein